MPGDGGLPYVAFGRLSDHTILASHCTLDDQEQATQIEDIFRRLLEASRQKLASGQRQRLQWNAGSVCCLLDQEGICLYCLVTESVNYPEKLAFQLLQELSQDVQMEHKGQMVSAGPYSLNKPMKQRMQELLQQFEDPKLRQVADKAEHVKNMMQDNVRKALEGGNQLDELQERSERMASSAQAFSGQSRQHRRKLFTRNLKLAGACLLVVVVFFFVSRLFSAGDDVDPQHPPHPPHPVSPDVPAPAPSVLT